MTAPVMAFSPLFRYDAGSRQGATRSLCNELNMKAEMPRRHFVRPRLAALGLAALGGALLGAPPGGRAEPFPFGHEFILDASPMRGSKKVPLLDIEDAGSAEIELWCNSVKAQLVVAGDTITIITGETTARQCAPERSRADEDLITAFAGITNWQMEGSTLVLTGSQTLRFRAQTN
jgi:hypothetical protein